MFKEVETELSVLEKQLFSGHVKFGIEHGTVLSMTISSRIDSAVNNEINMFNELKKNFPDEEQFYGNLDYNFSFGRVLTANYSTTLQGELLASRLRTHQGREVKQCRNVKVVVKK